MDADEPREFIQSITKDLAEVFQQALMANRDENTKDSITRKAIFFLDHCFPVQKWKQVVSKQTLLIVQKNKTKPKTFRILFTLKQKTY